MGYKPKHETVEIEVPAEIAPPAEGSDPFRVTIRRRPTQHEMRVAKESVNASTMEARFAAYAPFVVGWNIDAPPPSEAGGEQFDILPYEVSLWLLRTTAETVAQAALEMLAEAQERAASLDSGDPSHKRTLDA